MNNPLRSIHLEQFYCRASDFSFEHINTIVRIKMIVPILEARVKKHVYRIYGKGILFIETIQAGREFAWV